MKNKLFKRLTAGLAALMFGALTVFSSTGTPVHAAGRAQVWYKMHVQNIGWQEAQHDGATAGTTGLGLRGEGFQMDTAVDGYSGGITYRGHVQGIGWMPWMTNRQTAGTEGKSLRLEAFEAYLTGELAKHFDLVYRAHVQDSGWLPWVKNGQTAGTTGKSKRLEAMQVKLVPKASSYDQKVQSFTNDSRFRNGAAWAASKTPILSSYGSSGCCAYGADFVMYVYGKLLNAGTRYTNASSIKTGDVIHFSGGQHWVVVLYRNGSQLTTAEGNWGSKVVISSNAYTISGGVVYRNGSKFRTFVEGYHYQ